MDIKRTNMKKLLTYWIPLFVLGLISLTSCQDDKKELPRLFRPSFIASSCYAEENKISLAWRTSGEPTSYTVELSQDGTFSTTSDVTQTVTGGKCTFTNLKYETTYYARVRANNEAKDLISNWTVYESSISTLSRIIPKLLYPINEMLIGENTVTIEWVAIDDENPVDGLTIWTEDEMQANAEGTHRSLSESEVETRQYEITGLSARTVYYVALTNSLAPEGAENYNLRKFKTAGMPQNATTVTDGADLFAKIKAGMADDTQTELVFHLLNGVDYYLNESGTSNGKTSTIATTKSVALLANPGEHPTVYIREGGFQVGTNPSIDYFIVENVNIEENLPDQSRGSKTYLFGVGTRAAGEDFTIDRFEITNSAIKLPTGVIMMNESNDGVATINHIRIDNCLVTGINDTKLVTRQFGFIHAPQKGGDVWQDVSVSNSTFYEFYISPGVFGSMTDEASVSANGNVSITNCTFYNWATQKASYTAIGNFSQLPSPLNVTISGCVFGYSEGKAFSAGLCNVKSSNNYCTDDFANQSDAGLTLISLSMSDNEFFRNAAEGDFTIMDTSSTVYTQDYGDPRWINIDID